MLGVRQATLCLWLLPRHAAGGCWASVPPHRPHLVSMLLEQLSRLVGQLHVEQLLRHVLPMAWDGMAWDGEGWI